MVLNAKLRNRRLATPCINYGTVRENMESGVLFVAYVSRVFKETQDQIIIQQGRGLQILNDAATQRIIVNAQ